MTTWLPDVAVETVQGAEHDVALVEDQVRVLVAFANKVVGFGIKLTVTAPPPPPAGFMVITKVCVSVPQGFVGVIAILNVPFWVGVPEITPVVVLKDKPVGRTEAPIEYEGVEVLVVVVVYENGVFTVPEAVSALETIGRVQEPGVITVTIALAETGVTPFVQVIV